MRSLFRAWLLPHGVAVDGDGNIWVADTANRVLKFSPQGNPLMMWDRYGTEVDEIDEEPTPVSAYLSTVRHVRAQRSAWRRSYSPAPR